ncbi:MAG: protein-glutamate O-methyltransferase CheR [Nitrospirae bacterium]|nr:protein-glutamate O-methyltransferase CheR [Nitrospirota bacterium]MBF0535048.1 protein-glutamate O-methyltransferase CheR [Nitrospirota bacterium]MBF0616556.1 protein-glutamate O-methyltransferase CheR [Nitrospirota bacterium]
MELKDETFRNFRDFIYEKSGIYIPDTKKYFIENRLGKRIEENKLASFDDYLYMLKYNNNISELNVMFERITTNETFFFRELQQLEVLVGHIIPKIKAELKPATLRIWSSASSTGEEPYTIAMMLMENPKTAGIKFEILASDLSESVLQKARVATYGQYSIRNVPQNYLKKYFKQLEGTNYALNTEVRSKVKFVQINLLDAAKMRSVRDMDVVLCRNVLIYFDKKAKISVVTSIYESLKNGGHFLIGMAESLHDVTRAFKPAVIDKTVVYQKA